MALSEWPRLTPEQLSQYFERIALPLSLRTQSVAGADASTQIQCLEDLTAFHRIKVPFENLVQHYSWHRVINVSALHLFRKIVLQPGRGGYCMEVNTFLLIVLRTLGFDCYLASSRVYAPDHGWSGMTHTVIIVRVATDEYLVDVGYGANEPIRPLPLQHNAVCQQIPPAESRIVREALPHYRSNHKVWLYQFRIDAESPWTTTYCVLDVELLPVDVEGLNFTPWLDPRGIFTKQILCVRFTTKHESLEEPGSRNESQVRMYEIDGTLTLDHDRLKWRRLGKDVLDMQFQNEADRVRALRQYFGIELDEEDQEAIKGTPSEITPKS